MGLDQHPRLACLARLAAGAVGSLASAAPAFAEEGHGGGHELVLFPEPAELVPLIVLFILLVPLLNHLLFKPVFRILDAREERIDGARKRAAKLEQDAAAVMERYRSAVATARAEAEEGRKATLDAARHAHAERVARERHEAEGRMEAAKREIDAALVGARASLRGEIEGLARDAASRILGRAVS
jgi:F-type H+-transporting ATPase subunit b